jgi:fluoride exporter
VTATVLVAAVLAGSLGAVTRAEIVDATQRRVPGAGGRARGTAIANLTGTAVLAVVLAVDLATDLHAAVLGIVGIGFCGSLTTFSGWMVDAVRRGRTAPARAFGLDVALQALVGVLLAGLVVRVAS